MSGKPDERQLEREERERERKTCLVARCTWTGHNGRGVTGERRRPRFFFSRFYVLFVLPVGRRRSHSIASRYVPGRAFPEWASFFYFTLFLIFIFIFSRNPLFRRVLVFASPFAALAGTDRPGSRCYKSEAGPRVQVIRRGDPQLAAYSPNVETLVIARFSRLCDVSFV